MVHKFKQPDGSAMRPFKSVQEMNETIVANWNAIVRDNDKVYLLGDISMRYGSMLTELMFRLKGHKRLIPGNHDDLKEPSLLYCFEKASIWRIFKEHNFICSHVPLHPESFRHVEYNVHGHLHHNLVLDANGLPDPHYINVCVEHTNYTPISVDEIKARM
jgi:calcineurin-like phosphoesterase family protein